MWWANLIGLILPAIEKAIPDKAAQDKAKAELTQALLSNAQEIEQARAKIVASEAQSAGFLTRSWRPIAMLNFLALLDAYWLGYAPDYLVQSPDLVGQLFTLLTVGIGGYIGGRSVEKASAQVAGLLQGRKG